MAIKAGRVGVREDQVDPYGRIIENGPSLVDSEEIVFDEGAEGTKAYLAQEISNKIAKALQTPAVAPADHKLVGIDSSGAQEQIGIGNGLTLEGGELKISGGGSWHALMDSAVVLNNPVTFPNETKKLAIVVADVLSHPSSYYFSETPHEIDLSLLKDSKGAGHSAIIDIVWVRDGEIKYDVFEIAESAHSIQRLESTYAPSSTGAKVIVYAYY